MFAEKYDKLCCTLAHRNVFIKRAPDNNSRDISEFKVFFYSTRCPLLFFANSSTQIFAIFSALCYARRGRNPLAL